MSVYDYFNLALTLPYLKINCEQNSFLVYSRHRNIYLTYKPHDKEVILRIIHALFTAKHYIIKLASRWSAHCLKQNHYIIKLASKWSTFARFSLQLITETIHCLLLHKFLFLLLQTCENNS
jgi:hypothetical protein